MPLLRPLPLASVAFAALALAASRAFVRSTAVGRADDDDADDADDDDATGWFQLVSKSARSQPGRMPSLNITDFVARVRRGCVVDDDVQPAPPTCNDGWMLDAAVRIGKCVSGFVALDCVMYRRTDKNNFDIPRGGIGVVSKRVTSTGNQYDRYRWLRCNRKKKK